METEGNGDGGEGRCASDDGDEPRLDVSGGFALRPLTRFGFRPALPESDS